MPDIFWHYFLPTLLWILAIIWLSLGIIWIYRFRKLVLRLVDIATKPLIFKNDKNPHSIPLYPRIGLEKSVDFIRRKFANNYVFLAISFLLLFFVDISWRILYILLDVIQYFVTAPILAVIVSSRIVTGSISPAKQSISLSERISALKSVLSEIIGVSHRPKPASLKLSVGYPNLLSKRYPSIFKVIIYPLREADKLESIVRKEIANANITEYSGDTNLIPRNFVVIELLSQDIEFTKSVTKQLTDGINDISFIGKPKDTAFVGEHRIKLSITDKDTSHEYVSLIFKVKVVDFIFDHISRPFLSKLISFVLGLASVITYTLTLIGKIDETFGLASGTTAAIIATFIYARSYFLFQQSKVNASITTN